MSKIKNKKKTSLEASEVRKKFKFFYDNYFFNKWMNLLNIEDVDYQQKEYIMRRFWEEGNVAISEPTWISEGALSKEEMGLDSVIFTAYNPSGLVNIYNYPTHAIPVNSKGVPFIANKPLKVDEEIVLVYCQKNHKGIKWSIDAKISELVDVEMTIRVCLKNQKQPFIFITTPENKVAVQKLAEDFDSDDATLFTTLDEGDLAKSFNFNAPYIVDKLEAQRQKIFDDIMAQLSKGNIGVQEKKEHLTVGEVQATNQITSESGNEFVDYINEGFERANLLFSRNIKCSLAYPVINPYDEIEEENKEDTQDVSQD